MNESPKLTPGSGNLYKAIDAAHEHLGELLQKPGASIELERVATGPTSAIIGSRITAIVVCLPEGCDQITDSVRDTLEGSGVRIEPTSNENLRLN